MRSVPGGRSTPSVGREVRYCGAVGRRGYEVRYGGRSAPSAGREVRYCGRWGLFRRGGGDRSGVTP
ncbi:hypothetical protein [Paenibacillus silagei]|uniref:Diguanylate phosphodiesterase n=1 Tax=Paenibacillus silagei TaxID=1670801 RepID=A0ABS4NSU6_9BACL|nr:hypothetical protein [Paenibacillus silagei]MBP2113133.1 hypothetical protein [Paenibacillus silagei]